MSATQLSIDDGELREIDEIAAELKDRENVKDDAGEETSDPVIYNISSYGADLTAEQHVKRMRAEAYVKPEFQRSYIWPLKKASRFIESLILGLPVPSIFLYEDRESGKKLIVDGLQRLTTLHWFYDGLFRGKEFVLTDVHDKWAGRSYKSLDENDRQKLDDAILHTIIFKQDEPVDDRSSVYHVFERLNTGGMNLTSQEIRVCINHGIFSKILKKMNNDKNWRNIFGAESVRLKDQELILRFLALVESVDSYDRPMSEFLNRFMEKYDNGPEERLAEFQRLFSQTCEYARRAFGDRPFRPGNAINAAVFDACMVGLARRLRTSDAPDVDCLNSKYKELLDNIDFRNYYERATADKDSVIKRINLATQAFENC